jgi:signal peptidase I
LSSAQLVVLTSLVAIVRGLSSFDFSQKAKKIFERLIDLILIAIIVFAGYEYARHSRELSYYFHWGHFRHWMQNNMGTFAFTILTLLLLFGFRLAFSKEWSLSAKKALHDWLDPALLAGALALILITYVARTYYIPSGSMEPTLMVHDYIIVVKPFMLKLFHDFPPQRGDIVVFHPPLPHETKEFIKRVVGLPGETIQVLHGKVWVDGRTLHEPYIKSPPDYRWGPVKIPLKHYIVFGDNRNNSLDSHAWKEDGGTPFLSLRRIVGRAVLIIWPPSRFQVLHDYRWFQTHVVHAYSGTALLA